MAVKEQLDRRDFLKKAGMAVSFAAAAGMMAGCGTEEAPAGTSPAAETEQVAGAFGKATCFLLKRAICLLRSSNYVLFTHCSEKNIYVSRQADYMAKEHVTRGGSYLDYGGNKGESIRGVKVWTRRNDHLKRATWIGFRCAWSKTDYNIKLLPTVKERGF